MNVIREEKRKNRSMVFCALILLTILILPGCGKRRAIIIGVPESNDAITITEIYAQALEDAGYRVTRKYSEGDGNARYQALLKGELDLVAGYTGTVAENSGLVGLDPIPADNAWGLGMLRENAGGRGIDSLSDLREKAGELTFAATQDFLDDPLGFSLLNTVYGPLSFKKTAVVSGDELHMPLHMGMVDVIPLRAVDGHLADPKHIRLQDDRHAFTPQHLFPVVSKQYIEKDDQIRIILNGISKTLDDAEVIALNHKTAVQGMPPPTAAREYLRENGFLTRLKPGK